MPQFTFEIPEVVALRLKALAAATGTNVNDLACEALEALTASFKSRRAILKARSDEAKAAGTACSLADLGWLEGYTGQTVDELLVFEGTDTPQVILFALEEAIQKRMDTTGRRAMTGVERMVLSVLALSREVNNGGYDQFFRNSSRQFAPAMVSDLVRIGCIEIADITQRALDALQLPALSVPAIEAAMQEPDEERNRTLERCDIAFYAQRGLAAPLLTYVKSHPDGIRI